MEKNNEHRKVVAEVIISVLAIAAAVYLTYFLISSKIPEIQPNTTSAAYQSFYKALLWNVSGVTDWVEKIFLFGAAAVLDVAAALFVVGLVMVFVKRSVRFLMMPIVGLLSLVSAAFLAQAFFQLGFAGGKNPTFTDMNTLIVLIGTGVLLIFGLVAAICGIVFPRRLAVKKADELAAAPVENKTEEKVEEEKEPEPEPEPESEEEPEPAPVVAEEPEKEPEPEPEPEEEKEPEPAPEPEPEKEPEPEPEEEPEPEPEPAPVKRTAAKKDKPVEEEPAPAPVEEEPVKEEKAEEKPVEEPVKKTEPKAKKAAEPKVAPAPVVAPVAEPVEKSKAMGKYEVFPEAGFYKYRLKANNGEILIVSNPYRTKESALAGIDTLKKNVPLGNSKVIADKNNFGQFRIFTANDSRLVVAGEIYPNVAGAERALNSVMKFYDNDRINVLDEIPESEHREWHLDVEKRRKLTSGKLTIVTNEEGKFQASLNANNGELLFLTATYSTKGALKKALDNFKEKLIAGDSITIAKDKQDRYQFRLYSDNGMLLLMGETYPSFESAAAAANSARNFIEGAKVIE